MTTGSPNMSTELSFALLNLVNSWLLKTDSVKFPEDPCQDCDPHWAENFGDDDEVVSLCLTLYRFQRRFMLWEPESYDKCELYLERLELSESRSTDYCQRQKPGFVAKIQKLLVVREPSSVA